MIWRKTKARVVLGVVALLAGCTSVGFHDEARRAEVFASASPTAIRLCVLLDDGIDEAEAQALLADAWNPDEERVGIAWQITHAERYSRPAYGYSGLKAAVDALKVPPDCDRLMVFIGRHIGDVLYGLVGIAMPAPEVLGYADDLDRTRGYVVAKRASILQLVMTPASTLRHELYHLLGCEHGTTLASCYDGIAVLRLIHPRVGYLPGWDPERKRPVLRAEKGEQPCVGRVGLCGERRVFDLP